MSLRRFAPSVLVALACTFSIGLIAQDRGDVEAKDSGLPCISKGTGEDLIGFCPSNSGRINTILGNSGIAQSSTNMAICHSTAVNAATTYSVSDFILVSIAQKNGAGKLPLKIVSRSADNTWLLTSQYSINTAELEVVHTAALKRQGGPLTQVAMAYNADDFPGSTFTNNGIKGPHEVSQSGNNRIISMALLTRKFAHTTTLSPNIVGVGCNQASIAPFVGLDRGSQVTYLLGGYNSGATKTVKYQFRRG